MKCVVEMNWPCSILSTFVVLMSSSVICLCLTSVLAVATTLGKPSRRSNNTTHVLSLEQPEKHNQTLHSYIALTAVSYTCTSQLWHSNKEWDLLTHYNHSQLVALDNEQPLQQVLSSYFVKCTDNQAQHWIPQ